MDQLFPVPDVERRAAVEAAQAYALGLFTAIERGGLLRPGRSESDVEDDIRELAAREFGV